MDGSMAPTTSGLSLQEVPLAYVAKDDETMVRVRSKLQQTPPYNPPQRVESIAGGHVVHKTSFVSFRAIGKQIFLWENAVHDGKQSAAPSKTETASLAIQLPESVARNGVSIFESADKQFLSVCVVTYAKTVHRFCYKLDPQLNFSTDAGGREEVAYAMTSLPIQTSITSVCWLDECNVVVGADNGAVVAINVGLSIFGHSASSFHEVPLTDHSVLKWMLEGLGFHGNKAQPIVAIAAVPDSPPTDGDDAATSAIDTLIVTLSSDLVLRVWSYEQQSCLCNQDLRPLLTSEFEAPAFVAQQAALRFVRDAPGRAPRLLVHVTSHQPSKTKEIVLFRGELTSRTLELEVVRRFVVDVQPAVRLVDFTVDNGHVYAVWRSSTDDFVYVYPLTLTGPKLVPGHVVGGMHSFSIRQRDEDNQCEATTDLHTIDAFYLGRVFAADQFNDECIRQALGTNTTADGAALRRQVTDAVHRQWLVEDKRSHQKESHLVRMDVWKHFLRQCATHWASENIPLGLSACSIAGSPVLFRRNHMSIFFPSTRAIVTSTQPVSTLAHELHTLLMPFFGAYPHVDLQAAFHREWNVDVHVDFAAPSLMDTVRLALEQGLLKRHHGPADHGRALPQLLVRVSSIFTGDATTQIAVLDALVDHLELLGGSSGAATPATQLSTFTSVDMSMALHRMSALLVHELFASTISAVFFLAYLEDAQPTFCTTKTLQHIASTLLPRALSILRTWTFYKWLFAQTSSSATAGTAPARMIMQDFALDSAADVAPAAGSLALGDAVVALLRAAYLDPALLEHLKTSQNVGALRIVVRFYLHLLGTATDKDAEKAAYLRLLGDALLAEAALAKEVNDDDAHVAYCLERAVRCYIVVVQTTVDTDPSALYDLTAHLKEHVPRPFGRFVLQFLHATLPYASSSSAMQEFIWYNLFKLSLAEKQYHDAHLALNHVAASSTTTNVDECVRHFVLQLCDSGRLDIVVGFSWGVLEDKVEQLLVWQSANTHANVHIKRLSQNAVALLRLLYSFYVKRSRYAHAARALYTLFLRLELDAFTTEILHIQRDALLAAFNVLQLLPVAHRWFVCQPQVAASDEDMEMNGGAPLEVVTIDDVERALLVVRGKLLLPIGNNPVLSDSSAAEVVSLLLKHATSAASELTTRDDGNTQRATDVAVAISHTHDLDMAVVARALARHVALARGSDLPLQQLLRRNPTTALYLAAIDTLLDLHAAVPDWLRTGAVASAPLAGQALLTLYLKHGVLEEAVALADDLVPATDTLSQAAFRQQAADGTPTWLPHTLLDTLLAACDQVVADHTARGKRQDVAELERRQAALRQKLQAYFTYLKALDAAAAVARRQRATAS
ncbi:Aste57867_12027 [Aphanomyces stellatus]|uniref:Aste57867_12027 protein n=1 Tax=Aphanomyces stellatus TaxID=120398 RepID=A0A485KUI8_9STRA|nr:hypothetical protein As57867_011982 [Aphanomyces stellatus]VFT88882.1 Aste57867_12027 [Aphanomyces stellatus]